MWIADFHIHSKYSRATSKECIPEMLSLWARRKGIDLIGTGDFTHPAWREELREKLSPAEEGLYVLKEEYRLPADATAETGLAPRFIVSGEISSIYKKNGKVRKVHNLILLPGLTEAEALSRRLELVGNLHSDGRPILGLDSRNLLEIVLELCPQAIFIPAHIWTPHFSLFGAYSGFDHIQECFEDLTPYIHALETGLSSDPPMNWRLSALDAFTLVSNSDAHSPANLGREANLFDTELSYPAIFQALQSPQAKGFQGTIEFFPEEGKYHYDGHRHCKVCLKPTDTKQMAGRCPVCGGRITVGVLHRVEDLADRAEGFVPPQAKSFESLVPLDKVIAASTGFTTASTKVKRQYELLLQHLGSEFFILRHAPLEDIAHQAGPCIAEGIRRLRSGNLELSPGFDGEYGKIQILDQREIASISGQLRLFNDDVYQSKPKAKSKQKTTGQTEPLPVLEQKSLAKTQIAATKQTPDHPYGLNQAQWEAASALEPAVAVIAGPGTGKTRTLVYRIAHLVEQEGVSPAQITAVTFTNQAANEMRSRLEQHFGHKRMVKTMRIGTFHAICLQLLSQWRDSVTVIDGFEALSLMEDIIQRLGLAISPREALRRISQQKNLGQALNPLPPGLFEAYCEQLAQEQVLDYDDILLEVLREWDNRSQGQAPFAAHLLVDEFQDINPLQYQLIQAWGRESTGIFIIGDPDQAIYGFRGSNAQCFAQFQKDFPQTRQIRLIQNYRSTPEILHCALPVIAANTPQGAKQDQLLEAQRPGGAKVRLLTARDAFAEALFVAKEINRMVGGIDMLDTQMTSTSGQGKDKERAQSGLGFSDIALLYRTHRQGEMLEQCLHKEGISYVVVGRDSFLGDPLVRQAISFFRFLLHPQDLISLGVCLKAEAPTAPWVPKLLAAYRDMDKSLAVFTDLEKQYQQEPEAEALARFLALVQHYGPLIQKEKPAKLLESWIKDHDLAGVQSLEHLHHTAVLHPKMPGFLQNLVLGGERDVVRSAHKKYTPDAVSLMTIHGAKGLEFPVVFLCGVRQGMIPLQPQGRDCDWAEERRLFYVGLTRAQDELILLTNAESSPFLANLPPAYLETGSAAEGKRPYKGKQLSLFD